jgi:hypothetical protein
VLALISLLVLIAIFLTVARVAAVALEATGMARDSAEFQARSALLGVGFTTAEAEDITRHPTRRRLVLWLMTFGNAGIVTGIGSFILTFGGTGLSESLQRSGLLVGGLVIVLLSVHTSVANRAIESVTRAGLRRFTELDTRDFAALLRFDSDFTVSEFHVHDDEWMAGNRLADLRLTREGVVVLGLHRTDGSWVGTPNGDTEIRTGDAVLAYGHINALRELAVRDRVHGDAAHDQAVDRLKAIRHPQQDPLAPPVTPISPVNPLPPDPLSLDEDVEEQHG